MKLLLWMKMFFKMYACCVREGEVDDRDDEQEVNAGVDDVVALGDCAEAYWSDS